MRHEILVMGTNITKEKLHAMRRRRTPTAQAFITGHSD